MPYYDQTQEAKVMLSVFAVLSALALFYALNPIEELQRFKTAFNGAVVAGGAGGLIGSLGQLIPLILTNKKVLSYKSMPDITDADAFTHSNDQDVPSGPS